MEKRINIHEKGQDALKSLFTAAAYLKRSSVDENLLDLVFLRTSQMNGCAYCIDMHHKDLRFKGETEQRLYGLLTWRETAYYTEREQAALAWTEAVTLCKVPDELYSLIKKQFSDEEVIDLTIAVNTINSWNRLNIAFNVIPGTYQVGQFK